jgi:hypothetical protein
LLPRASDLESPTDSRTFWSADVCIHRSIRLTPAAAAYAYVIPGGFLETAAPGAHHSASFVMATYVFLAEK